MRTCTFFVFFAIISIISLGVGGLYVKHSPVQAFVNMGAIVGLCILSVIYAKKSGEKYDYDQENPNALIRGRVIGGTVYAAYPENDPGLGWIL